MNNVSSDSLEKIFGPDDAVNGLRRSVSDGTSWKSLLGRFWLALVTLSQSLNIDHRAAQEANIYIDATGISRQEMLQPET